MGRRDASTLVLWLGMIMLASAVGGLFAAGLFWALGAGPVASVGAAGATCAGVATMGIAVLALVTRP